MRKLLPTRSCAIARLACVAAVLCGPVDARASDPPKLPTGYSLTSWSKTDGLPPGDIWALAQDAAGYLWLGTDSGPVRFDGVRFIDSDLLGLPTPRATVRSMLALRDGTLWVGFASGGISRIKDNAVTTYTSAGDLFIGQVTNIVEDEAGAVLALADGELLRFDGTRWIRSVSSGRLFDVLGEGVINLPAGRSSTVAPAITRDARGRIWLTDPVFGFRAVDATDRDVASRPLGKGLALLSDRRENLWVATLGQGLWRVHTDSARGGRSVEVISDQTGLSNNSPLSLLEDRDGNIWVGTANGLNRLTPHRFNRVGDLGLVMGLESRGDGNLWAGTADGVVELVAQGDELRPATRYLQGSAIRAMHAAPDGTLWAVTGEGVYSIAHGQVRSIQALGADALPPISGITSDGADGLWFYADGRGLMHWRGGRLQHQKLPPEFDGTPLASVITDRKGRAWFAFFHNQLAAVNADGQVKTFGVGDGLDVGDGRAVYEDRDGAIWVVGSRGVARMAGDRFVTVRPGDAVLATLTSVIDGGGGSIWFGSAWGLVRIDRREFDQVSAGQWNNVKYDLFDGSDGVSSTTRWNGHRNVARTLDGRLWFLTVQGVTIVNPSAHYESCCVSPVVIDDVVVDGHRMLPMPDLNVASGSQRFEINFTVPNLTSPATARFRYRLDGFDRDWIDANTRRQAIYTNLPPRAYVFRLEVSDQTGGGDSSTMWAFSVAPAFYQTTWFYAFLAASAVFAVGGVWRLRMMRIRKNFALILGERVRLSRQIHDTLLQSLVGVSLQLDQLGHDVGSATNNSRDHVVKLRKQIDEYIRDARQSIWNLRSSMISGSDLATALRKSGERITQGILSFDFKTTGVSRRVSAEVEEQLLRIGQEALTNAVRHSGAHHVSMELQCEDRALILRVIDDGCGFDTSSLTAGAGREKYGEFGHWGVTTMKERAAAVGGDFRLSSTPNAGTVVEALIPVAPR